MCVSAVLTVPELGMYRIVNFILRPEPDSKCAIRPEPEPDSTRDSFTSHTLHTATDHRAIGWIDGEMIPNASAFPRRRINITFLTFTLRNYCIAFCLRSFVFVYFCENSAS